MEGERQSEHRSTNMITVGAKMATPEAGRPHAGDASALYVHVCCDLLIRAVMWNMH